MRVSKFINWPSVTLVATLTGVAVPIWLWSSDLNSRSLSVSVVSQVALTSDRAGAIKGLQVTLDGAALDSPVLSVLQIANDGKRPIIASDFEGPLQVRVGEGTQVVRTDVTVVSPQDIEAKISWDTETVRLAPLLLNPDDAITVSILTSGRHPNFTPKARVSGVPVIRLSDESAKPLPWKIAIGALLASILLFAASGIADASYVGGSSFIIIRRRAALFIMNTCGLLGMVTFFLFFYTSGLEGMPWLVGLMVVVFLLGTVLAVVLNRGANALANLRDPA